MFEVNYLSILLAAVAGMIFGMLYYSPIMLGNAWMKEMGYKKDDKKLKEGMAIKTLLGFLGTLVTAFFLAVFINLGIAGMGGETMMDAILTAMLAWAGFVVTLIFGQVQWEGKSYKLFLINILYQGVTFVIMGAIIGAWM